MTGTWLNAPPSLVVSFPALTWTSFTLALCNSAPWISASVMFAPVILPSDAEPPDTCPWTRTPLDKSDELIVPPSYWATAGLLPFCKDAVPFWAVYMSALFIVAPVMFAPAKSPLFIVLFLIWPLIRFAAVMSPWTMVPFVNCPVVCWADAINPYLHFLLIDRIQQLQI